MYLTAAGKSRRLTIKQFVSASESEDALATRSVGGGIKVKSIAVKVNCRGEEEEELVLTKKELSPRSLS